MDDSHCTANWAEVQLPVTSLLRGKISSDFSELDELSGIYPWLPNSRTCRPNEIMLREKELLRRVITIEWRSAIDYISYTVFGRAYSIDSETGKKYTDCLFEGMVRFVQCTFPYKVDGIGFHYVLWYGSQTSVNDDTIDEDIKRSIEGMVGRTALYEYGWYLNPKQTVPSIFHVQVFWTLLEK